VGGLYAYGFEEESFVLFLVPGWSARAWLRGLCLVGCCPPLDLFA